MRLIRPGNPLSEIKLGDWTLYELAPYPTASFFWRRFKFMLAPTTLKRRGQIRSVRFEWNLEQQNFVRCKELFLLEQFEPEIYDQLAAHLRNRHSRDSMLAHESEIQTERNRLKARRIKAKKMLAAH